MQPRDLKTISRSRIIQRFWEYAGAVSVRVKVLGIVLGVILLLGGFVIMQIRDVLNNALLKDLQEQGIALAHNIAVDAGRVLQSENLEALHSLLVERKAHYSSESHNTLVDYIFIRDPDARLIAAEGSADPSARLIPASQYQDSDHEVFTTDDGSVTEIRYAVPGTDLTVYLGLSLALNARTVNEVSFQLFSITLVMVAIGFGAAFFLTWVLTRPLGDLVSAAQAVAQGDFSRRVPRWADDEIGELATAFNAMTAALQRAESERHERERLREQYISGVIEAQENERQRIARELHDSTSQSLTSLLVGLQNLKDARTPEGMTAQVEDLRGIVAHTLDEVRRISWQLRPSILDDLGLVSALHHHIETYQKQYNLPVETVFTGLDGRLSSAVETTVYRIVQEGLTNVARYAQATAVSVIITRRQGVLRVIVEDNGIGFDPAAILQQKNSLGLHGIRERATLLGGSLAIESEPGHGTSLFVEIPDSLKEEPR
jgi:signal transduction histidine kinase